MCWNSRRRKKYYWKVVWESPQRKFFSCSDLPPKFVLKYKIGEKTVPKIGKIFIFNTRKNARNYIKFQSCNYVHHFKILKVRTVGTPKIASWRAFIGNDTILQFWSNKNISLRETPQGTYFADAVIPVELSR